MEQKDEARENKPQSTRGAKIAVTKSGAVCWGMSIRNDASFPRWQIHPNANDRWNCEILAKPDPQSEDDVIAYIEDFHYGCYASALNARTGNWERRGASTDRTASKLWAERVAGLHPDKPGDERLPFYYKPKT